MSRFADLTGERFGRLTAVSVAEGRCAGGGLQWHCRCDCGGECVVPQRRLAAGERTHCPNCNIKRTRPNVVRRDRQRKRTRREEGTSRQGRDRVQAAFDEIFGRQGREIDYSEKRWRDAESALHDLSEHWGQ